MLTSIDEFLKISENYQIVVFGCFFVFWEVLGTFQFFSGLLLNTLSAMPFLKKSKKRHFKNRLQLEITTLSGDFQALKLRLI